MELKPVVKCCWNMFQYGSIAFPAASMIRTCVAGMYRQVFQVPQILHFEPLSLRSDAISSINILYQWGRGWRGGRQAQGWASIIGSKTWFLGGGVQQGVENALGIWLKRGSIAFPAASMIRTCFAGIFINLPTS